MEVVPAVQVLKEEEAEQERGLQQGETGTTSSREMSTRNRLPFILHLEEEEEEGPRWRKAGEEEKEMTGMEKKKKRRGREQSCN